MLVDDSQRVIKKKERALCGRGQLTSKVVLGIFRNDTVYWDTCGLVERKDQHRSDTTTNCEVMANQHSGGEKKRNELQKGNAKSGDAELPCVCGLEGISSLGIVVALVKVWSG
jgi:hypothetical protein